MSSLTRLLTRFNSRMLDKRIFYLHFEKCGGTSLQRSISSLYEDLKFSERFSVAHLNHPASLKAAFNLGEDKMVFRESILHYYLSNDRLKFVRGHFQISPTIFEMYNEDWEFITVLRNPVDRFLSHYFFNVHKNDQHDSIVMSLDEYVCTDRAKNYGQDYVAYVLGLSSEKFTPFSKEQINEAIQLYRKFSIVGQLENMEPFYDSFQQKFAHRITEEIRNRNPVSKYADKVDDNIMERINDICQVNTSIYNALFKC